jgi:hypothetical protein
MHSGVLLEGQGSFDSAVVRFANHGCAQDDDSRVLVTLHVQATSASTAKGREAAVRIGKAKILIA